jgi:hypothetical protein
MTREELTRYLARIERCGHEGANSDEYRAAILAEFDRLTERCYKAEVEGGWTADVNVYRPLREKIYELEVVRAAAMRLLKEGPTLPEDIYRRDYFEAIITLQAAIAECKGP